MNVMNITITGRVPSKKNSKRKIQRGHKTFMVPSKEHEEWHEDASWQLYTQKKQVGIERCSISIMFYMPDRRRADLTNKAESVMDLLVDNGILKDDSWQVVRPMTLDAEYDKENPRVEVCITQIETV